VALMVCCSLMLVSFVRWAYLVCSLEVATRLTRLDGGGTNDSTRARADSSSASSS
jgi:hypothetical protein